MFSAAKDGEALYNQQKQHLELIVALIISKVAVQRGLIYSREKKGNKMQGR